MSHDFVWWRLEALALGIDPSPVSAAELDRSVGVDRFCYKTIHRAAEKVRGRVDPPTIQKSE